MVATLDGTVRTWGGDRDEEGHRTFTVVHLVRTDDFDDGPQIVMNTPGLPAIGSFWNFGNDVDVWAFCYPDMNVKIHKEKEGDPNKHWRVRQKFSTIPLKRCQDETIEDPLLEPQKISGSFVKYTKEASQDRFGNMIKNSAHETYRGPQVEFDHNRPTVRIEQNQALLGLDTFTEIVDTVNDAPLWGLGVRKIKLSDVSWERKLYGLCNFYYTRVFDFDIDFKTFDREILDEGTKVLNGDWPVGTGTQTDGWILQNIAGEAPDKNNPQHFNRFKDRHGENARVILDGNGEPLLGTATFNPYYHELEFYPESNLLLLGIPTSL